MSDPVEQLPVTQMTVAEVKELYRQRRYDEIVQAREDGRLDTVLGVSEPR